MEHFDVHAGPLQELRLALDEVRGLGLARLRPAAGDHEHADGLFDRRGGRRWRRGRPGRVTLAALAEEVAEPLDPFAQRRPAVVRAPGLAAGAVRLRPEDFTQCLPDAGEGLRVSRRWAAQDMQHAFDVAPEPAPRHAGLIAGRWLDTLTTEQTHPPAREVDTRGDSELERAPEPPVDFDEAGLARAIVPELDHHRAVPAPRGKEPGRRHL